MRQVGCYGTGVGVSRAGCQFLLFGSGGDLAHGFIEGEAEDLDEEVRKVSRRGAEARRGNPATVSMASHEDTARKAEGSDTV